MTTTVKRKLAQSLQVLTTEARYGVKVVASRLTFLPAQRYPALETAVQGMLGLAMMYEK